jgi:Kef-type K+ transport system membrane component KefB
MVHAVELFATFFVPFYFFHAGLGLRREDFSFGAIVLATAFLGLGIPFRLALVALHRLLVLGESFEKGMRIGVSMIPTLVFTLVIAGILRERYDADPMLFGGLIVYTLVNTLIPGFVLRQTPPEFGPQPDEAPTGRTYPSAYGEPAIGIKPPA